jgi:hypothetical protein
MFSPFAVGESRVYQEACPVCGSALSAILDRTSLGARVGRGVAADLDMPDRVCFAAGTGTGGVVNVSLAAPCLGAGCGSGRAAAVIDFSFLAKAPTRLQSILRALASRHAVEPARARLRSSASCSAIVTRRI